MGQIKQNLSKKFKVLSQNKDINSWQVKIMRQTNQSYDMKVNNNIKSQNYELNMIKQRAVMRWKVIIVR